MKNKELIQDDFLKELVKHTPLDAPSDEFTVNVMSRVEAMPRYQPEKKPFVLFVKSVLPWILLVAVFVVIYIAVDLPFGKFLPGSEYLKNTLIPSVNLFVSSFNEFATGKFYSISLVIIICSAGLFGIERLVSHRVSANRHFLV